MNVIPTSRWSCLSSICISWRSLRSSAPSGSSRSSTVGWLTRARARATRCCCPPDSSHVRRRSYPLSRTSSSASPTRRASSAFDDLLLAQPVADVLGDVHVREQGVVLEDRVHVAPVGRDAGDGLAGEVDLARGRLLEAGDHAQGRGLAAARRPEERVERPARDRQAHRVDRDDVPEPLGHVHDLDVRRRVVVGVDVRGVPQRSRGARRGTTASDPVLVEGGDESGFAESSSGRPRHAVTWPGPGGMRADGTNAGEPTSTRRFVARRRAKFATVRASRPRDSSSFARIRAGGSRPAGAAP